MGAETPTLTGIAALLNDLWPVFTTTLTQLGKLCETIIANPLLLIGMGFVLAGFVVGMFSRITRSVG